MTTTTESIMKQAQVFASAWSLVDSPFDDGTFYDAALEEKAILQSAIEALVRDAERMRVPANRWPLHSIKQEAETALVIGDEIGMRDGLVQILRECDAAIAHRR